jgi:predicted permease
MVWIILALGIGANTAVFRLVDQVLLRPPPFQDPDRLLLIWNTASGSDERLRVPAPDAGEIGDAVPSLAAVAFMGRIADGSLESPAGEGASHVRIAPVTPNLFAVLGVEPSRGPGFSLSAGEAGAEGATPPGEVVLSHDAWVRLLGRRPDVIGRDVLLNGAPARVAGVLPSGFRVPMPPGTGMGDQVDVWAPLPSDLRTIQRSGGRRTDQDSDNTGAVVARLTDHATLAQARAELEFLTEELQRRVPEEATTRLAFEARILWRDATRHLRGILNTLLVGVGVVLLITCLNLSTLILARGTRRASEFAVRAALGAPLGRVARQLITENLILVVPGALLAVLVALGVFAAIAGASPYEIGPLEGGLDLGIPVLAAGITLGVVFVSGLAPALRLASREAAGRTGAGFLRGDSGAGRIRGTLLTAEVALSVTLLFGTFLLLKTARELRTANPGFEPRGVMTFHLSMRVPGRYPGPADRAELARTVVDRLSALPGVESVGLTTLLPLAGRQWTQPYGLPGQSPQEWDGNRAEFRAVTSGFFSALGVRLVDGRSFTAQEDRTEERRVVLVDERLAERIAPGGSAVGLTLGIPLDGSEVTAQVVGVVENVRYDRLDADGREVVYVPYRQEASREVSFVVRTTGDPAALAPAIRATLRSIDPQLPVYDLRTLGNYLDSAVAPTRFAGSVLGAFALLALLALSVGLYGVVALEAARRTPEIGLRMAIGADSHLVVGLIVGGGLRMVGWGAGLGCVLSGVGLGWVRPELYGTGLVDPWAWVVVAACMGGVAGAACWIPARRAASLDPTVALRRN